MILKVIPKIIYEDRISSRFKPIKENLRKVNAMTIEEILSKEENQTFDRKSSLYR